MAESMTRITIQLPDDALTDVKLISELEYRSVASVVRQMIYTQLEEERSTGRLKELKERKDIDK